MDKLLQTRSLLTEMAVRLDASRSAVMEMWRDSVASDPGLDVASDWTLKQLNDHFPDILESLGRALRAWPDKPALLVSDEQEYAVAHARTRWLQGYSLTGVMREWAHLNAVVVDHIARAAGAVPGVDAHVIGIASKVWALIVGDQQTSSAREYHQLEKAEAETRGAELQRLLDVVRDSGAQRGRALESLASEMRNNLQLMVTSNTLKGDPEHWAQNYELDKLSAEGLRQLERSLIDMVTLANLEAGLETAQRRAFDAGHGFELLVEGMRHIGQQQGVELTASGPTAFMVEGDGERVRRIAKHLLFCAFRAPSTRDAILRWGADPRNEARWQIEVEHSLDPHDSSLSSSAGMALARATDAGQQAEGAEATGYETALKSGVIPIAAGDGVDLLIAKHLCELLDASLEVEMDAGRVVYRATLPTA